MGYLAVKVCILGDSNVGKSSIAVRLVENSFNPDTPTTIGAAFLWKNVETDKGTVYKLQIWDTAGQERYRSIAPLYYRGASVVLIVYDITFKSSFFSGAKEWFKQLKQNCDIGNVVLGLVGNKQDLESLREVDKNEARQFASSIGASYWEASAKTGYNVDDVFYDVCCKLEEKNKNLTIVPAPSSTRERTLTVISHPEEPAKRHPSSPLHSPSHCCERNA